MVVSCCVINCTLRYDKRDPKSFYRIPKNPEIRRHLWLSAIKRQGLDGKSWKPTEHDRVCFRHFVTGKKSDDPNSPDYVPSVSMGGYVTHKTSGELRMARLERQQRRQTDKNEEVPKANVLLDLEENMPPESEPKQDIEADVHDTCIKTIAAVRLENKQLYTELGRMQTENTELRKQLQSTKFGDHALSNDRKTLFYTGVPSKAIFMWLLSFCSNVLPTCKVMSPSDILLCVLMKLRLNLQHQDIAFRFGVSVTTISDVFNQSIPQVAKKFNFLIQWPDKDNLIKNMPVVFKQSYPRCVSIIDCFEVFIQRPGHLTARAQTWSNYKHNNTIKFLVSITPTGAISYVSRMCRRHLVVVPLTRLLHSVVGI